MADMRVRHPAKKKFSVAIEACRGDKTISEIASRYKVHPVQVSQWKKQLQESSVEIFSGKKNQSEASEALVSQLYEEVGRLKVELDWLKKKLPDSTQLKREMIEVDMEQISIARQCELIGLPRASFYYEPASETDQNLLYMSLIDRQYMKTPFWGSRNMTTWLNSIGHEVNRKRVQRLMRLMGIEAIYPKPKTSQARAEHKKYPYLLRDLDICRPNQVWCTDITYWIWCKKIVEYRA